MLKAQAALYLLAALIASLAANVFIGWQWAQSKAQCRADTLDATNAALRDEWKRMEGRDRRALEIGRRIGEQTARDAQQARQGTDQREDAYRRVPVTGACRMPGGLPDLRPAVDAARAAAGD